jgi:hypothetical protein
LSRLAIFLSSIYGYFFLTAVFVDRQGEELENKEDSSGQRQQQRRGQL